MVRGGKNGGKIALRSSYGRWLSAQSNGSLRADRQKAQSWEYFDIFPEWC